MKHAPVALALALAAAGCGDAGHFSEATGLSLGIDRGDRRTEAPIPAARRDRSLVWTDAHLLDDPSTAGLARLMDAAAGGASAGAMFEAWLARFATTPHSERAAPAQWALDIAADQGADATHWDLDAIDFKVTAVHNRIDLAVRSGGCGELRVSLASTHDVYAPFHLIFMFRQPAGPLDIADDGTRHCRAAAQRWARLSDLDGEAFQHAAQGLLDEILVHDNFLMAESLELTVSPWEWRQWVPDDGGALGNPTLFQTVDTPRLNTPGPLRDSFATWVEQNAPALAARQLDIPSAYCAASARVAPGIARQPLDLSQVRSVVTDSYPDLAQQIEIVGCPSCHTHNADFVHTKPDRSFSAFYDDELEARRLRLDRMHVEGVEPPPFGPLQPFDTNR